MAHAMHAGRTARDPAAELFSALFTALYLGLVAPVESLVTALIADAKRLWRGYLEACRAVNVAIDRHLAEEAHAERLELAQAVSAKAVGKGLVTIGLVVVVLNEVFSIDSINNSTGPFSGVITTIESIGESALTLLAVAFIVLAGAVAMRYMDRF